VRRSIPSTTERRIAAGLRTRDPDAVRALYAEYGGITLAVLREALDDRGAVEDVMQQVFLEAWQRCPSYDPNRASLGTWLCTIARSRAIDHLRRRIPEPCDATVEFDACGACTNEPASAVLERMALGEMLRRLPQDEAEVVWLRFHLGLSQREIVARTGIPLGTVKSRTASALRRLRRMLEDAEGVKGAAAA
jgi:RNA polymerase sigma-70 factor (ECF subfamily)